MARRKQVKEYFQAFSNKDIDKLSEMFDDNAQVKDWEIDITGKKEILAHNQQFFDSISTIDINVIGLANISEDYIMADISILIDNTITVEVQDRITFNAAGKITRIKAYKK